MHPCTLRAFALATSAQAAQPAPTRLATSLQGWENLYEPFPGIVNAVSLRDRTGSPNRTMIAMVGDSGAAWIDSLPWPQTTGIRNHASRTALQGTPPRLDVMGKEPQRP